MRTEANRDMAAEKEDTRHPFLFIGNALWLDFVNTEVAAEGVPVDLLETTEHLKDWLVTSGIVTDAPTLSKQKEDAFLQRAREFRASLRKIADQMACGANVFAEDVTAVNHLLGMQQPQLVREGNGWRQALHVGGIWEDAVFIPIAQSAADVLSSGEGKHLVRKCEGPTCILYFYDTSKNHKRRWCSMAGCGNRHKAAEHYRRNRQQSQGTTR